MLNQYKILMHIIIFSWLGLAIGCQANKDDSSTQSTVRSTIKLSTDASSSESKTSKLSIVEHLSIDGESNRQTRQESKWVFVGDSLTAGYGLESEAAYVALIQAKIRQGNWLDSESNSVPKLINAGISGDTSAGALRRLDWLLADQPSRVFLCIGANDGLRGQSTVALKKNLTTMIQKVKRKGIQITLMGMQVPPNYGPEYSVQFKQSYVDVAREQKVSLYPFLLKDVAGVAKLNQSDGIHPNHEGQKVIAEQLFNYILKQAYLSKAAQ